MNQPARTEWCPDTLDLFRLATVLQHDSGPLCKAEACYVFGHTPDNEAEILSATADLYHDGWTPRLYLCGGGPYMSPQAPPGSPIAYSGFPAWQGELLKRGVHAEDILEIPRPELSHTDTEAQRFVNLAKRNGWRTCYIVAWAPQMLRAYTNTVTYVLRTYPELKVYALSSQGTVHGTILDAAFAAEYDLLNRWFAKGDLVSASEVLRYYEQRERRS